MVDEQSSYYQRVTSYWSSNASSMTATTASSSSLFSRLLDALLFTSAIAITAYSYLTGTLVEPMQVENVEPSTPKPLRRISRKYPQPQNDFVMEDQRRRRTQEWAEQQLLLPSQPSTPIVKRRSCSTTLNPKIIISEKKRTQSLPANTEDALFSKIQSMIQECQEALSSPVPL